MRHGAFARPAESGQVSGDRIVVLDTAAGFLAAVIDGLGHGPEAAVAAAEAEVAIRQASGQGVDAIVRHCHALLRNTRGAALALVRVDASGVGQYCGVGNVEIVSWGPRPRSLFSSAGIVGHRMRQVQAIPFYMESGDVYCMFTDGVSRRMKLEECLPNAPEVVAKTIVERWGVSYDDASALVFARAGHPLLGGDRVGGESGAKPVAERGMK